MENPLNEILDGVPFINLQSQKMKGKFRFTKGIYDFLEINLSEDEVNTYLVNAVTNNSEKDIYSILEFEK